MTDEDLAWIEANAKSVRSQKVVQKSREYPLYERKRVMSPKRRSVELGSTDGACLAAASLHTFFRDSYSKHHPGHTPEEDAWEQNY